MPLPSREHESDLPTSLSQDLAPHTSSPKSISDDVLVSANPHTTLNDFCEIQGGEDLERASELDLSITTEVEYCDLDDSKDIL